MDHLQRSRLNLLTSDLLNRGTLVRLEPETLSQRVMSDRARFIGIHRMKIAVDSNRNLGPAWLTRDETISRFGHCESWIYLGEQNSTFHFALMLEDSLPRSDDHFVGLRALAFHLDASESTLLAFAQALTAWHKRHGYCGQCGTPTIITQGGHVRVCSAESCGTTHYPRTDPAIIVLVESDDHALFGRKPEWPKHRYSTIAGFVEPGESAEQAVVREVAEETNINVLSAHYHSSQPWPFPGSLMLGYHAKAPKTQISLNDQELEDAQWLSREEIITRLSQGLFVPPPKISISFRLIEDWFNQSATIPLKKLLHQSGAADF